MSHSHKKMSGPPSALRVPSRPSGAAGGDSGHGSRSSSLKKSGQSGSSGSGSQKKKSARAWDDSIHDLSVHKLPKQKQMEKQLKRLSRQQLGQIAAMPMPPNRQAAVARAVDALSPTHSDRHTHQQQHRRQRDSSSSRRSNSQARVRSGSRSRSRSPSASSFSSPQHETGEWDGSSVGSTPESHSSSAEDNESAVSTPSPHQQRASRQQPLQQRPAALVHSAKPQVPRQNRPVNKEQQAQAQMQPAPLGHAPLSRHVAAPVVTSAPPSQENSDDETGDDSFSAFAPAGGSASTATMANYSPWLKPNHMLSPVLERSISDSAASTPNAHAQQHQQQQQQHQLQQLRSVQEEPASARHSQIDQLQPQSQGLDRPFFTDSDSNAPSNSHSPARPAERRSVAQQPTEQNDGSSRNLLADLRHSLDAPLHDSNVAQQGSTLASMPLPTLQHFLSLMSTLASHLSEREAVAAKEAQFKTSTVASLSGCNAQLKALTARLDEVERENRAMKAAALQQSLEHEKSLHAVQQQVRTLEQRLEQMALAPQQQAQTNPMQLHGQPSAPTHAYNPTLYHSQHLSHSALPTSALSHPSSSSIYSMHAPAQGQQQSQQHPTANRAPSPPRPIVINHSTNAATVAAPGRGYAAQQQQQHQQQQQQQQHHHSSSQQSPALPSFGSRLSEVNVHVADGFRASTQQMAMGPRPAVSASAVPPTHKLAWQAAKSAQQQQQQQQSLSQSQMRPQTAPQGAMRQPSAQQLQQQQQPQQQQHQHQPAPASRFHSTLSDAAAHDLDGSDDFDDEAPRERMATAAHAARFAPFSPGSEQDDEEARQFAQQAAKMRAQTVAFGAIQGRQPQQQPHQQQQQQQR